MLRRRVIPDEETYETLVQLLVTRAHDTIEAKGGFGAANVFDLVVWRKPGKFMLQSSEMERDILAEDHSLSIAVKLFDTAIARHSRLVFPLDMYRHLIIACAKEGKVEDMIRIYAHMESQKMTPHATIFPSMIMPLLPLVISAAPSNATTSTAVSLSPTTTGSSALSSVRMAKSMLL